MLLPWCGDREPTPRTAIANLGRSRPPKRALAARSVVRIIVGLMEDIPAESAGYQSEHPKQRVDATPTSAPSNVSRLGSFVDASKNRYELLREEGRTSKLTCRGGWQGVDA